MTARPQSVILAVLFAGVLVAALDIAIVGPALSSIGEHYGVGSRALQWVFSIYVLFYLIGTPLLAKLSDRRGRRALFAGSLALFAAGSLWVAVAPSFGMLLAGRALQAFGAGGIFPVASAVIAETVPVEKRGRMLGLIGAVFGIAFLVGPLLGGVLLEWSWRWLFVINVPIAAALIALGLKHLPKTTAARPGTFDFGGAALLSVALAAVNFGLSQLDTGNLPASLLAWPIWPCILAAAVAVPLFWRTEKRAPDPVLHPDLFRSRQLKLAGALALAAGLVEASMVFLPKLAVVALGVSASASSFMMLPLVLTLTVGAPLAGAALDRFGARIVVQIGLLLTIAGLALFGFSSLDTVAFYASGALVGFGLSGLLGAPLRYIVLEAAGADRRGAGQGLLTLFLSVGQLLGAALIGGVVASSATELGGYRQALLAVAAGCALALMLSAALRGRVSAQDA
ncbi:MAG TPA: MFS transporter [Gammaproteobacteria bacterium]|nr:MFS transporter [Gammaproteobacteria bacterium]